MILQGKGGVGKSFIATMLAQFLKRQDPAAIVINTDEINETLLAFPGLEAISFKETEWDNMIEFFVSEDKDFVVDNGSSNFQTLCHFFSENQIAPLLRDNNKEMILHTPITGSDENATIAALNGLIYLFETFPETKIIVWLNEHFGSVEGAGKTFQNMEAFKKVRSNIAGIVTLPQRKDLFNQSIKKMQASRLLLDESLRSADFLLLEKQRLKIIHDEAFYQLKQIFGEEDEENFQR